jgi:YVTN family beta-propeller protein
MVLCALSVLGAPLCARPAQAAPFAYVANDDSSVFVIDTAINEVVAKVPTAEPPRSLAVSTDGKRVYVIGVRSISVLGTSTNTVVATVMVDTVEHVNLDRVAVAPDGKRAYVTGSFFDSSGPPRPANLVILVFDTVTKTVLARKKVDHVGKARGIAVSRDGKHVYVGCDECAGKLFVLDTDSNNVATINIPPDVGVSGIATAPDGKRVYVSDGKLLVLDTATHEIRTITPTGFLGKIVAITPDGKHAYFFGSSSVSVLDIARNTAATTPLPNGGLSGMAITPDGKHAYATGNGRVWVIDTTTNTVVDTLTWPNPTDVATMPPPDGNVRVMTQNMYMGNPGPIRTAAANPETLPGAVAKFFNDTVATNPAQRAAAIAKKIHDNRPDLVALQEVGILRKGSGLAPNDAKIPATEVVHDQLQLLRDALTTLGEHYDTVAVIPNIDLQFSSTLGFVVRITDRTAILARASSNDLKLSNVQVEEYMAKPVVSGLIGIFGWGSVDVNVNDRKFRFVATHLTPAGVEPALIDIQTKQASELIQSAGKTDLPVVYAGDFNTVAGSPTYQILVSLGGVDAWQHKNPMASCKEGLPPDRGCTCCQDSDLHNDTSKLSHRFDLVIVPPNTEEIEEVELVGADPADHTSRLWPSDHAGVVAILKLPRN